MLYKCSDCPTELHSIYSYHLHLATEHQKYEDGQYVEGKTLRQLEKVGARVLNMLLTDPETRNPKNWPLWTKYLQRHSKTHILVYDEAHKGWMINRPDGVLKADDLRELFAELETCRRRRQDYQKADKDMYHLPNSIFLDKPHKCILAKEKDRILADEKEKVMRREYSGQYTMEMI